MHVRLLLAAFLILGVASFTTPGEAFATTDEGTLDEGTELVARTGITHTTMPVLPRRDDHNLQGGIRVGGALLYADDTELGVRGEIYIPFPGSLSESVEDYLQRLEIGAEVELYASQDFPGGNVTFLGINVNARGVFAELSGIPVYALAGINILRSSVNFDNGNVFGNSFDTSDTDIGLNLGAGGEYVVGPGAAYGEVRLQVGGGSQVVFAFGYRLAIGG